MYFFAKKMFGEEEKDNINPSKNGPKVILYFLPYVKKKYVKKLEKKRQNAQKKKIQTNENMQG